MTQGDKTSLVPTFLFEASFSLTTGTRQLQTMVEFFVEEEKDYRVERRTCPGN